MKTILRIFLSIIIISSFLSCKEKVEPKPGPDENSNDFAVLVYMVASNSLGSSHFDTADLVEMEKAADQIPPKTRWLVYHAPSSDELPVLKELKRDGSWTVLKEYSSHKSATTERLSEVIEDFRTECKAKADGMVFWSHATGWLEDGTSQTPSSMQKSFGVDFNMRMNVSDMAKVLDGKGFRFFYFDACFMGTIEVVYELRSSVEYIICSPAEVPADGMPYNENLPLLLTGTVDNLIAAATNTFNLYNNMQDTESRTCTMSVISTAGLERLARATKPIYLNSPLPHPLSLVTNYRGLANYGYSLDFGEYATALCEAESLDPVLKAEFEAALNSVVLYCAATPAIWAVWPMRNPTGLATYVFNDASNFTAKGYNNLQWSNDVVEPRLPK